MSIHAAAESLHALLRERNIRIGVAESCTGGLISGALTDVPGSSETFIGGIVAYDDDVKRDVLGLDGDKLAKRGSVSAWCVEAMAHAVRDKFGADMGIAVSGICGPGGGTIRKPIGTVWMAVCGPEHLFDVRRLKLKGDRPEIRQATVEAAIQRAVEMIQEATAEGVA